MCNAFTLGLTALQAVMKWVAPPPPVIFNFFSSQFKYPEAITVILQNLRPNTEKGQHGSVLCVQTSYHREEVATSSSWLRTVCAGQTNWTSERRSVVWGLSCPHKLSCQTVLRCFDTLGKSVLCTSWQPLLSWLWWIYKPRCCLGPTGASRLGYDIETLRSYGYSHSWCPDLSQWQPSSCNMLRVDVYFWCINGAQYSHKRFWKAEWAMGHCSSPWRSSIGLIRNRHA